MITSSGRSRIRSTVVVLSAAALTVAGTVVAHSTAAGAAPAGSIPAVAQQPADPPVENDGADCAVTVPGAGTSNPRLPDPFTKLDGTRITTKDEWRCRRQEINKLAEQFVYGEKGVPESVTGTVSATGITVNVSEGGRTASFSAGVSLPSGPGPHPAVIVYGGFGADTATIRAAGAAVINYDPFSVGREGTPRNAKSGAYYNIYGAQSRTGLLMAWAWGVSRIIDVIEQSDGSILTTRTGVTGCSRFGKGAFVAGVFDQRVALTMPIESGTGGVGAFRVIAQTNGAQPLSSGYGEQPWLGDAFGNYQSNPAGLPVDTHEMIGMIAPRGLFVMDNPHIDWLGASAGATAALAGAEVYKALGAEDNITYWSAVGDGTHCASRNEWRAPLQANIQEHLLGTGNAVGEMRIQGNAGNLGQWVDWQTPTLAD